MMRNSGFEPIAPKDISQMETTILTEIAVSGVFFAVRTSTTFKIINQVLQITLCY